MDFRNAMLDRIDYLGLEIERMKDDISGLESQIEAIHEHLEDIEAINSDFAKAINEIVGKENG